MSTLHTINRSPSSCLLDSVLNALNEDDAVLFIEDGVYYCSEDELLNGIPSTISVFGLREDLGARGIAGKCAPRIDSINYRDFVALSVAYDKTVSWF